jgi:type IX secretion system PorP/SprF family membrane protein
MRAFYLIIFFAVTFPLASSAQNSIRPNIYLQDMQYYNPASIALDSTQSSQAAIYGKYKSVDNQDDIWKKPMNLWLSHVGRIGSSNSFYTISYVNDVYSFYNRNAVYIGYVKQKKIGRSSVLSLGGRIVGNFDGIHWDKFELPHTESGSTKRFNPDLDLGVAYQFKKFKAGLGIKNLIASSSKIDGSTLLKNHREFNVNLSYQQNIGRQFAITPFVLLANERSTLIDAGLSFSLLNKVRASYALRVNELKSVITLDVDVYKGFSVGVAYDRSSLVSDNNFDFVLRYRR